jgi:uncharacterized protein (TIGR02246 family)
MPNREKAAHDEVSAVIDDFWVTQRAGDLDAFMNVFAEDALWMLPNQREDGNKAEAREYYGFLNNYAFDVRMTKDEIQVSGADWAFARVTFEGHLNPKPEVEGESTTILGRHFMVFKRQDSGVWKIARDIWIMLD